MAANPSETSRIRESARKVATFVAQLVRRHPTATWTVVVALSPWLMRSLAMGDKRLRWLPLDIRGFWSDWAVAGVIAVAAGALLLVRVRWLGRPLAFALLAGWVLVNSGNHEHVAVLDSNANLRFAEFVGSKTFMAGSAAHFRRVWLFVLLAGLVPLIGVRLAPQLALRQLLKVSAAVALSAVVLAGWQPSVTIAPWRQTHVIEDTIGIGAVVLAEHTSEDVKAVDAVPSERIAFMTAADTSGTPRFTGVPKNPNIVLVMLEGITGAYLDEVAALHQMASPMPMPRLSAAAKSAVLFPRMIAHNRQTDRGEYAILCGDYPQLKSITARMRYIAQPGSRLGCLPAALAEANYHTAYLQSAGLVFMAKDGFMANVGFHEVYGEEYFEDPIFATNWGVDDKTLFRGALDWVAQREQTAPDQPWFLTLLTVGTHHPYATPDDFPVGFGEAPQRAAIRYADEAIGEFLDGLEAAGRLDDTVVLITSDEASGLQANRAVASTQQAVAQNWSFLVAHLPGVQTTAVIDDYFVHSDLANSVLDVAGLEPNRFVGRSVFRTYEQPRPVIFAHVYSRRIHHFDPTNNLLHSCDEGLGACAAQTAEAPSLFAATWQAADVVPATIDLLAEAQRYSIRHIDTGRGDKRSIQLLSPLPSEVELDEELGKRQKVFSGQQIYADPGRTLAFRLLVEVVGPDAEVELMGRLVEHMNVRKNDILFVSTSPTLGHGDRFLLHARYAKQAPFEQVNFRIDATRNAGDTATLRVLDANMDIMPTAQGTPLQRAIVDRFEVIRAETNEN